MSGPFHPATFAYAHLANRKKVGKLRPAVAPVLSLALSAIEPHGLASSHILPRTTVNQSEVLFDLHAGRACLGTGISFAHSLELTVIRDDRRA